MIIKPILLKHSTQLQDNRYFEDTVNQSYPPELLLNITNAEAPSWIYIYLFLMALCQQILMTSAMILILT